MNLLITKGGDCLPVAGFELYRYFGYLGPLPELLDYSVRNLGAVYLHGLNRQPRIRLRPGFLSERAFEQVVEQLLVVEPERVAIELAVKKATSIEVFGNLSDVVARLYHLRDERDLNIEEFRFRADHVALARLREYRDPTLRRAYQSWLRQRGEMSRATMKRLLDAPIGADCLLARVKPDTGPVPETLPSYVNFWGKTDLYDLLGKPMADHPDPVYGLNAARGFLLCDHDQNARLELIDAAVMPRGGPVTRLRYDRLSLPWRTPDGTRFVSSTSFTRIARQAM